MTVTTTHRVLAFASEAFRDTIADLLDDPSSLLDPSPSSAWDQIALYRAIASDLGIQFNHLCEELGTPAEVLRLRQIEAGTYTP